MVADNSGVVPHYLQLWVGEAVEREEREETTPDRVEHRSEDVRAGQPEQGVMGQAHG